MQCISVCVFVIMLNLKVIFTSLHCYTQYCLKVNQVEDERKRRRWVQDSEKKKLQVSKDNFFPVPLGRNRKEIATQWFQDLASNKSLALLAKKVGTVYLLYLHSQRMSC